MAADRGLVVLRALVRLGRQAWMLFYRFTFGQDVFISYARLDGQTYALGLQRLLSHTVSVLMDQYVGEPGIETPPQVMKGLKRCRQLVIVATPAALASKNVDEEIRLFPRRSRAVQVIAFGAALENARWFDAIPGLSKHAEDPAKLESGHPSAQILETICNSVGYWRQRRRNNLQVSFAVVSTVLGIAGVVWLSRLADKIQQQQQELSQGKRELALLTTERDRVTVERKSAMDERDSARREASARRDLAGIEARRKQIGYVPPDELPLVLRSARTLEAGKLEPEAVAALSAVVDTMPHLVRRWRIPDGVSAHATLRGTAPGSWSVRRLLAQRGGSVSGTLSTANGLVACPRVTTRFKVSAATVNSSRRPLPAFHTKPASRRSRFGSAPRATVDCAASFRENTHGNSSG